MFSNNIGITSVYHAMSKSPKQLPNCLRGVETSIILIVCDGVLCEICPYNCYHFLLLLNMNQIPEKAISWSVTL
jgi:hypothetical protein